MKIPAEFDTIETEKTIKEFWVNKHIWATDKKAISSRIWKHKYDLAQTLQDGLTEAIITGQSPDVLIKEIVKRFDVAFYQARRLVITELAHIQVQSSVDSYKAAGIKYYKFITAHKSILKYNKMHTKQKGAVCSLCMEFSKKDVGYGPVIYPITDTEHLPPDSTHPFVVAPQQVFVVESWYGA